MNDRTRLGAAVVGTVALFVLVQLGALALVEPFQQAEYQAVEDPSDPANSALFFAVLLVATGVMLAVIKYEAEWLIRASVIGVSGMLTWYVLNAVVPGGAVAGVPLALLPILAALGVIVGLIYHPEWYVIDTAGVLMGAGAAGMFGISFGLLPAIAFLVVLAVYDAISVYKTKHMLTLADGVMGQKIPVLLVIPTSLSYSFREAGAGEEMTDDPTADGREVDRDTSGTEPDADAPENETVTDGASGADNGVRDALFIGLGDAVMPTILVASAAFFIPAEVAPGFDLPVVAMNLPALGAMVGTIVGLVILLRMVLEGRAHAGLPLLNGGAIAGYLLGALASGLTLMQAIGIHSF
ncbi:presenilin family intramembrane aspartyl protease PSH [Natranaeroarchaeum sulfidigenes]|uniref:Presenilin-like membrane protease, A22 family n=1 Tax=Natranaeroarchaeum sulfidigenes TaxID=2784880 RepID=A0A897MPT1_9EURY|nr:presenilin family intramembrane aspartyl protease PSH [Natranaeroarchaeum sulfidigenes]QSG02432.1 Presenilin-like membrane protease, A22 family [Natranaeroarchaeum sulfidigenes]